LSPEPLSFTVDVLAALPARSVAEADGVQVMVPLPAAVSAVTLGVPSVIVIVDPFITIVDGVPERPKTS
jgi:3-hydroxyisobutyrate dehydrogenase-like beta-hydroxyacid dehydrogenase